MLLSIRHTTHYRYEQPVSYAVQRLVLTPPSFASQKVLSWTIEAPGIERALSYTDGFGNIVHVATSTGKIGEVTVTAHGTVETSDAAGVVRGLNNPMPETVFLRQTRVTWPNEAIKELAGKAVSASADLVAQLHA